MKTDISRDFVGYLKDRRPQGLIATTIEPMRNPSPTGRQPRPDTLKAGSCVKLRFRSTPAPLSRASYPTDVIKGLTEVGMEDRHRAF
jgi:hypothetical protein